MSITTHNAQVNNTFYIVTHAKKQIIKLVCGRKLKTKKFFFENKQTNCDSSCTPPPSRRRLVFVRVVQ